MEELLREKGPPWLPDLEQRLVRGVPGAQDAFAVIPAGGQFLASACVNKCGDVGLVGHCYTRLEHRQRGLARTLMAVLVSWFDMTGGKWLFLGATAELDEALYLKFGFAIVHRVAWRPFDHLMLLRTAPGVSGDPLADVTGDVVVREVGRGQWPAMVALFQYRRGADPRVALHESAVTADVFTLDLIQHQERGACRLLGAYQGSRLVGLATVATDCRAERTYAMLMPHTDSPPALRAAVEQFAQSRGYVHVDYPMEGLRRSPAQAANAVSPAVPPAPVSAVTAISGQPPGA